MSWLRALWFIVLALVSLRAHIVAAQSGPAPSPSVSVGFAVPMDVNTERVGEVTGDFLAPAIWGAGTFVPSSLISLHTEFDLPMSYHTSWVHQGSAGFNADIKHQDMVLSQLVGFRPRARTQADVLIGFGLVFARNVQTTTYTGAFITNKGPVQTVTTDVDPAIVGGINVAIDLGRRASLVTRIRARATFRNKETQTPDWLFGRFNVTPSVGVQFRFP